MSTIIKEFKKEHSDGKIRTFISFLCDNCGEEHSRPKKDFKSDKNYCSPKCYYATKPITYADLTCAFCKKDFRRKETSLHVSRSGLYFCSRACKDKGQRIENNIPEIQPEHYGEGKDYREKAFRELPNKCNICDYNKYLEVLEVHHKDCNRENNELENLEILCPTHHTERHVILRLEKFKCEKL